MKEIANEILNRDYPNIRKEREPSGTNKYIIDPNPPQKKKGIGL